MSYTPNTWTNGDIITAEKMNALEQAVASGGGSFVVGATENSVAVTFDKTWQEIYDAMTNNIPVFYKKTIAGYYYNVYEMNMINSIEQQDADYFVVVSGDDTFTTDSANGYPSKSSK